MKEKSIKEWHHKGSEYYGYPPTLITPQKYSGSSDQQKKPAGERVIKYFLKFKSDQEVQRQWVGVLTTNLRGYDRGGPVEIRRKGHF